MYLDTEWLSPRVKQLLRYREKSLSAKTVLGGCEEYVTQGAISHLLSQKYFPRLSQELALGQIYRRRIPPEALRPWGRAEATVCVCLKEVSAREAQISLFYHPEPPGTNTMDP